jgi:hypothetical protein
MDFLSVAFGYLGQLPHLIFQFVVFVIYIHFDDFRLETFMTSRLPELYLFLSTCLAFWRIYCSFMLLWDLADALSDLVPLLITCKLHFFCCSCICLRSCF